MVNVGNVANGTWNAAATGDVTGAMATGMVGAGQTIGGNVGQAMQNTSGQVV